MRMTIRDGVTLCKVIDISIRFIGVCVGENHSEARKSYSDPEMNCLIHSGDTH